MKFTIDENLAIHLNRGDQIVITLEDEETPFAAGDKIKFSIMKEKDCTSVIFQKEFIQEEESNVFDLVLTSEDTRLGNPLKAAAKTYWYEIEYNDIYTLVGFDKAGPKEFILYPEAVEEEGDI